MSDVSVRDLIWFDPGLFEARDLFMVTSAGRRGLRTGDVYDLFFNKCYDLPPGNSVSIAEVDGPGVCVRLNITLPHMVFPHSLSDLELTVRIDDNVHAAIQGPIGDLFCCPFGRWRPFDSMLVSAISGGLRWRFTMPFSRHISISVRNRGCRMIPLVFHQVEFLRVKHVPQDVPVLRAGVRYAMPAIRGRPVVIADIAGTGWLLGTFLQTQNLSTSFPFPLVELPFPQGWGLGHLEGWERVFIDGQETASLTGTGHEELFDAGWYFTRSYQPGYFSGVLQRSYISGRTATYRFRATDPIPFSRSLRVELDHGVENVIDAAYAATVWWYEVPPLCAQPEPPPPERRRWPSWLGHAVRFAGMLPLAAAALIASAPRFRRYLHAMGTSPIRLLRDLAGRRQKDMD